MALKKKPKEDIELEFELLTGVEKAALFLSVLGQDATREIFKQLGDQDVEALVRAMNKIRKAPISQTKRVLEELYALLSEEKNFQFTQNRGKDFILSVLGEDRAKQVYGEHIDAGGPKKLEALALIDNRSLANFLIKEHPQTTALIMAHLSSDRSKDVLKRLPEGLQAEIVFRIANLDFVSPQLIVQLDNILKLEFAQIGSMGQQDLGGPKPVANILNLMDKKSDQRLMAILAEKDPQMAAQIEKLRFQFEDLIRVDDKGIQALLKEADQKELVLALKTATKDVKDKLYKNMSNRAAKLLQEDLESLGPKKLSEVQEAQSKIVNLVKDLEKRGLIYIAQGSDDGDQLV